MNDTPWITRCQSTRGRVASVDAFRGLTILIMAFVNELAGMKDIPPWMKHFPANGDGMTFVDVVFPAFLFIMGMAIPFALGGRIERGEHWSRVCGHVLGRTARLVIMGVFMVNMSRVNAELTGMTRAQWCLAVYMGFILIWNDYPASIPEAVRLILRLAGISVLVAMAAIYGAEEQGRLVRMRTSWWGILGLIGWAYLLASVIYLAFRNRPAGIAGMLAMCVAIFIGDKTGMLGWLNGLGIVSVGRLHLDLRVHEYFNVGGHIGGHTAVALAGVLVARAIRSPDAPPSAGRRIGLMLLLAASFMAGGFLLRSAFGINKNAATPTWGLYSAGFATLVFSVLYVVMDVVGWTRWSFFLRPAGASAVLAYILPSIIESALSLAGITWLDTHFNAGSQAIVRSAVFALLIVALTGGLMRLHVRLKV
ncbi:MAG: DUF5009 domain-containing protein [Phycisphaerae bacterium]|nr:DUF5009 domain-containing protein [Phycisphaerae bacterium]